MCHRGTAARVGRNPAEWWFSTTGVVPGAATGIIYTRIPNANG
jgi:hypothetical protein